MRKAGLGAIATRITAGFAVLALVLLSASELAESGRRGGRGRKPGVKREVREKMRFWRAQLRGVKPYDPLLTTPENPGVHVLTPYEILATGSTTTITIQLRDAPPASRFASFHVSTDSAALRYAGHAATGRGALRVEPDPDRPGEIAVYRSSLPEGFGPNEDLVQLQFQPLVPGSHLIAVTAFRLLGGNALDLDSEVSLEAGELHVE